jgi:anaerobic dimethyl sulfoxide reductase subunit A
MNENRGEEVFYNTCTAAGCHQLCALKVWVKDGVIRKLESADYPGDPGARSICLKGLSNARLVYHPDRLKYPLKRIGDRGEGKWQRITWDEAFGSIAANLLAVKEKYGPESVKVIASSSSHVGMLMGRLMAARFANVWGAGGVFEPKSHWLADMRIPAASLFTLGDSGQSHRLQDLLHSKMVVLWGGNPAETYFPEMRSILDARDRGAKIVVIGPLFDATAAKADQWIPIRPATDAALAMAMINVIIEEGLYDKEFVVRHTVGPLLVRGDSKLFLREGGKYRVWNGNADTPSSLETTSEPALFGSFTVDGVACKPAFQILAEKAAYYTPERAGEITGVPSDTIRGLALEYGRSKPAAIRMYYGMSRTLNSTLSTRAAITLAAITGNVGLSGGGASIPQITPSIILNEQGVACPPGAPGTKTLPGSRSSIRGWKQIREGKPYPVKVLFNSYRNDLQCDGHVEGYREIFKEIDLVVVMDIFMTRTAQHADIVLPEATIYERDDLVTATDYLQRLEKAIEPLYETKPALEIWSEIGRRAGLGEYFQQSSRDYMRVLLDSGHPSVSGITLERLEKEKIIRGNVPFPPEIPFARNVFPTPSGRVEFYSELLVEFGQELPIHQETLESPLRSLLASQYPLTFLTAKVRATTHSVMANVDWMKEVSSKPMVDMNPIDAEKRGINDGDLVLAFNDRGKVKLKARLNEAVRPGTVNVPHGWWPEQFAEGHYSDLLHRMDDLSIIDPVLEQDFVIRDSRACSGLIHYDCLAEVQKA